MPRPAPALGRAAPGELRDGSCSRRQGSERRVAQIGPDFQAASPPPAGRRPENSAGEAAVGDPRWPRAVTGPPAAPTLTLRRLGSRARPPQPPGGLPRPQRRKQPPALLAAFLSCSHLCAHAPPPPPPEGCLLPPPLPRVCQVPGSRPGRRGCRGRSLWRRRWGRGVKGAGGAGNSGSRGTRGVRPGPGVGASYCDGLAREALSSRQLSRRMLLPCVLRADVVDGVPRYC